MVQRSMSGLPDPLKRELAEVDQMLEVVQGKLKTVSGKADLQGLPKVALHVKRKNAAIGHAREDLRDDTPRVAAGEARP
jgi:hypothetical protein